ncbi:hypothetical protein PZA11_001983 [Diplocarpon coronariae]
MVRCSAGGPYVSTLRRSYPWPSNALTLMLSLTLTAGGMPSGKASQKTGTQAKSFSRLPGTKQPAKAVSGRRKLSRGTSRRATCGAENACAAHQMSLPGALYLVSNAIGGLIIR